MQQHLLYQPMSLTDLDFHSVLSWCLSTLMSGAKKGNCTDEKLLIWYWTVVREGFWWHCCETGQYSPSAQSGTFLARLLRSVEFLWGFHTQSLAWVTSPTLSPPDELQNCKTDLTSDEHRWNQSDIHVVLNLIERSNNLWQYRCLVSLI